MANLPATDKEVIQAIGADTLEAAGYTEDAIKKWRQRGIPWKHRANVAEIAKANKTRLPADFIVRRAA